MDYINSNKLLFVLATPGGGGNRLGRIVSCCDNVFWYANETKNGITPWDIFSTNVVKGRNISPYHYDRRTKKNMIPLAGERIEKFWDNTDLDTLYNVNWQSDMTLAGADEIINRGQYITWVLHDDPEYMLSRFPNAKVINLIDDDINEVVSRYLSTTALFPINIENTRLKPADSKFIKSLTELMIINSSPTYRDHWAWENFNKAVYDSSLDAMYLEFVNAYISDLHIKKQRSTCGLNVKWSYLGIDSILSYLGSNTVDENYIKLLP